MRGGRRGHHPWKAVGRRAPPQGFEPRSPGPEPGVTASCTKADGPRSSCSPGVFSCSCGSRAVTGRTAGYSVVVPPGPSSGKLWGEETLLSLRHNLAHVFLAGQLGDGHHRRLTSADGDRRRSRHDGDSRAAAGLEAGLRRLGKQLPLANALSAVQGHRDPALPSCCSRGG